MDTHSWLRTLISLDTTSRLSNLGLIETVRDALRRLGIDPWLNASATQPKANLFATLPARDGSTQGGIILSGHTDVVPVDGQPWRSNPFTLTEREGRLYGRGSADMKGFIAAVLAWAPSYVANPGCKPVHLALSYDEEVGCLGARALLHEVVQRGIRADGCIVGEPTSMQPVIAHKGISLYHCRVHGRAAHSSLTPQGCNAIEYAARLISHIRDVADACKTHGPFDEGYDVPFSTLSTNLASGGMALNVIPAECEFSYEIRNLPGSPAAGIQARVSRYVESTLLPRMRAECPDARIDITPGVSVPALDGCAQTDIARLVLSLAARQPRKVAYVTEAGLFQQAGIPAIVCGPGSIEQAHKADEYIALEQLEQCDRFLQRLGLALGQRRQGGFE